MTTAKSIYTYPAWDVMRMIEESNYDYLLDDVSDEVKHTIEHMWDFEPLNFLVVDFSAVIITDSINGEVIGQYDNIMDCILEIIKEAEGDTV